MGAWGKCDFKSLQKLQKRLERLAKSDFDRFCREAARELAALLLNKVIHRTPVGHKPIFRGGDGKALPKTAKVQGASGKSKSFLTREGAILEQHWAGYMGGTLRRGWTAKTEQEAESGGGADAQTYAKSIPIQKVGSNYSIEIVNPVHYASYVEYGHRQQPGRYVPALGKSLKSGWAKGRFMLTISEQELQTQAPGLLEKKLELYLRGCFDGQ